MELGESFCRGSGNENENASEIYIIVPKKSAQRSRQFLSNENRFLNHKDFLKCDIDETCEDRLGIPIIPGKLVTGNDSTEQIYKMELDEIRADDALLCEQLAVYLNIPPGSVQIKKFNTIEEGMTQRFNKSGNVRPSETLNNSKVSRNTFKKLQEASLEVQKELKLEEGTHSVINVPKHWEIHGDLVLFPANSFKNILTDKPSSEEVIKLGHKNLCNAICSILSVQRIAIKNPGGIQNDDFRSPNVMLIYGFENVENLNEKEKFTSWAQRVENGIIQTWDITQCMFSVGNISEKLRVANFNCENEIVVDLFAGIGYFVLPYLIHAKAKHVYACEWNPASVRALKRNLDLNNIAESKCTIFEGDNRLVCPKNIADRVNLGLIPSAENSYKTAVDALKNNTGGTLHIHANVRRTKVRNVNSDYPKTDNVMENEKNDHLVKNKCTPSLTNSMIHSKDDKLIFHAHASVSDCKYNEWRSWAYETAQQIASLLVQKDGNCIWKLNLIHLEHVKAFAPFVDHLVLDLQCTPILQ